MMRGARTRPSKDSPNTMSWFNDTRVGRKLAVFGAIGIDLHSVTVSLGFELGWVLVRQSYAPSSAKTSRNLLPMSPGMMEPASAPPCPSD
jgi:hypothetical protein